MCFQNFDVIARQILPDFFPPLFKHSQDFGGENLKSRFSLLGSKKGKRLPPKRKNTHFLWGKVFIFFPFHII